MKRHHAKRRHALRTEKRKRSAAVAVNSNRTAPPPDNSGVAARQRAGSVGMVVGGSPSPGLWLPLFLMIGIGFGLLVAALATQPALASVYQQHKTVVFLGLVTAASVAVGLVLVLLGS